MKTTDLNFFLGKKSEKTLKKKSKQKLKISSSEPVKQKNNSEFPPKSEIKQNQTVISNITPVNVKKNESKPISKLSTKNKDTTIIKTSSIKVNIQI